MIAQVFTVSPPAAQGDQEGGPGGETAQKAMAETRAADGCEGLYVLADPTGGEGLAVVLWRDEDAMNAMRGQQDEHISAARQQNPDIQVGAPKVFEVITSL
jgi:quinol monooxygenase YgiN